MLIANITVTQGEWQQQMQGGVRLCYKVKCVWGMWRRQFCWSAGARKLKRAEEPVVEIRPSPPTPYIHKYSEYCGTHYTNTITWCATTCSSSSEVSGA